MQENEMQVKYVKSDLARNGCGNRLWLLRVISKFKP